MDARNFNVAKMFRIQRTLALVILRWLNEDQHAQLRRFGAQNNITFMREYRQSGSHDRYQAACVPALPDGVRRDP